MTSVHIKNKKSFTIFLGNNKILFKLRYSKLLNQFLKYYLYAFLLFFITEKKLKNNFILFNIHNLNLLQSQFI